jgi:hypothetical protein
VPSSSGTSTNRRASLLPSAAARYRELHVNRTVYLLAAVALLGPWVLWLFQLEADFYAPRFELAAIGGLHRLLFFSLQSFTGGGALGGFTAVAAAAFGVALFGYDRSIGGLRYTLETPLRRRDVLAAKALFGGALIVLCLAFAVAGTLAAAALSGNLALAGPIALRGLVAAAGQLSLFATALALGSAVGTVFTCLGVAFWAGLPLLLPGLVSILFAPAPTATAPLAAGGWAVSLARALPSLSALQPAGAAWPPVDVIALTAWFVAWTAGMLWQGSGWWLRAPFERLGDGVFFPFLWNLYYAYLSLASGLFVTTLITRGTVLGLGWALIYAVTFVAGWFFWRSVVERHGRRAAWRQNVAPHL